MLKGSNPIVGSEIFDGPADFETPNFSKSEVMLAAEQRERVREAVFFDNHYSDETISASAHVRLCTTEW